MAAADSSHRAAGEFRERPLPSPEAGVRESTWESGASRLTSGPRSTRNPAAAWKGDGSKPAGAWSSAGACSTRDSGDGGLHERHGDEGEG